MKNKNKCSLLFFLVLFLIKLSFFLPVFAQESPVLSEGANVIVFSSRTIYAERDLFGNFKDLMPGDVKEEEIILENQSEEFDYIKVYIRTLLPDKEKNPLSSSVAASGETIESMEDFLSKISIRVYHRGEYIYHASTKELGKIKENVYLGRLKKNESIKLKVELEVPIELGNKYGERMGEVDWIFLVEAFDEAGGDPVIIANRKALIQTGQKNRPFYLLIGMIFLFLFFIINIKEKS